MKKLTLFLAFFSTSIYASGDLWLQGRLFIANTSVKPSNLNTTLTSEGLKNIDKTVNYGVEITFPVHRFFEPGMRFTHRVLSADENPTNNTTNYALDGKQESLLLMTRFPIIKSPFLRLDTFAGVGGSNTKLSIVSASHNGAFSKTAVSDWYASPYYAFGASFGVGINSILLYCESGYEFNKVKNFTTSGTVNSNFNELNLSGSYFLIGIMFDGVKGTKK
jgi:hypothetical protein